MNKLFVMLLLTVWIGSTQAEVKYSTFNKELAEANSFNQSRTPGDDSNRVAEFDKEKVLRCWQRGQLIMTDRGWKPINGQTQQAYFKKGNQKMFLYNFDETFCIYTGE